MPGSPVVISGSEGSGSEVVAQIVAGAGRYLGAGAEGALRAGAIGDFEWIWGLRLIAGDERAGGAARAFRAAVASHRAQGPDPDAPWGWAHSHSQLLLPFLVSVVPNLDDAAPELRFIHVVRDGRDLAEEGQDPLLGRYGAFALGPGDDADSQRRLRFWAWANLRAANLGEALLGQRYLRIRFEDLCARPDETADSILAFAGIATGARGEMFVPHSGTGRGASVAVPAEAVPVLHRFGYGTDAPADAPPTSWIVPRVRGALAPPPERKSWPTVSIIVPTHNGLPLLQQLVRGLTQRTDYPAFELVVVDNASEDGTVEWLEHERVPFPVSIVRNPRNFSFAAACNAGAADARGELLLFFNNDVEPFEDGWLRRLVACILDRDGGLAGAVLADPDRESVSGRTGAIQHAGIAFGYDRDHVLRPALHGLGADLEDVIGPDAETPGAVAACALIRRDEFEELGGFHERFRYGGEDTDLCLRLAAGGRPTVVCGSVVLLHHPLSTRRGSVEGSREMTNANNRVLLERWGPALRRELDDDRLRGRAFWSTPDVGGPEPDVGVRYCVRAAAGVLETQVSELVAALRAAGRAACLEDDSPRWLLDDVVVHLHVGRAPHTVVAGRCNVLIALPAAAASAAGRYDAVVAPWVSAEELVTAAEDALDRVGGPRRIGVRRSERRRRAVVVLGVSRSGTSATARLLNLLGVELGGDEHLLGAVPGENEKGFWEHREIMELNGAILRRLGGNWREPPALPPGWERAPALDDLRDEALRLLGRDFAGASLWGFKDPRASLTLPFWRPLLGDAVFVVCHRHPLEIAASLARRNGLNLDESVAQWRRYTAAALAHTASDRRLVVGYAQLLREPDAVLDALAELVGSRRPDRAVRAAAHGWIDRGLRHHAAPLREMIEHPALNETDRSLALLLELASAGHGPEAPAVRDALAAAARRILEPSLEPA